MTAYGYDLENEEYYVILRGGENAGKCVGSIWTDPSDHVNEVSSYFDHEFYWMEGRKIGFVNNILWKKGFSVIHTDEYNNLEQGEPDDMA